MFFILKSSKTISEPSCNNETRTLLTSVYCKVINEYKGEERPSPFSHTLLHLEPNDIIQVIEYEDMTWWKGVKYKFNGSLELKQTYKLEGFFSKSNIQLINSKETMDIYSWYLRDCTRDDAERILNKIRIFTNCKENVFLVRSKNNQVEYAISVSFNNRIVHFKIIESFFDPKWLVTDCSLKNSGFLLINNVNNDCKNLTVLTSKYYSLDERYFLSLVDLIDFYRENSLQAVNCQCEKLGISYREIMPMPIAASLALENFLPKNLNDYDIELKQLRTYFVVKIWIEMNKEKYLVFDENGELGYAFKKLMKII